MLWKSLWISLRRTRRRLCKKLLNPLSALRLNTWSGLSQVMSVPAQSLRQRVISMLRDSRCMRRRRGMRSSTRAQRYLMSPSTSYQMTRMDLIKKLRYPRSAQRLNTWSGLSQVITVPVHQLRQRLTSLLRRAMSPTMTLTTLRAWRVWTSPRSPLQKSQ